MKRIPVLLLAAFLSRAQDSRTPVLLELFTSEGCSCCPPADQLLTKIDHEQPVDGVDLIVLGEHVDYWDHDGWADPYASHALTIRQQRYADFLHVGDIYTPELVVDGAHELLGSDWPKAKMAIEAERHERKLAISLQLDARVLNAKIALDPSLPDGDVYLALAADTMETDVKAGENSGRHLSHVAVVYSIAKIGKTSQKAAFEKSVTMKEQAKWGAKSRVVLFVQDPKTGHVLGVARAKL